MKFIEQKVERLHETGIDLVVRAARNCYQSKGNPENNLQFFKGLIKRKEYVPLEFWRLDSSIFSQVERTHYNFREYWGNEEYDEKTVEKAIEDCKPFTNHNNWVCLELTTNLGIHREVLQYRLASRCTESTRYINYSKNGLMIIPTQAMKTEAEIQKHLDFYARQQQHFIEAEQLYKEAVTIGLQPEEAADVLPKVTACKCIIGMFKEDWQHFLDQRFYEKTGKVHRQMKELASMIKDVI